VEEEEGLALAVDLVVVVDAVDLRGGPISWGGERQGSVAKEQAKERVSSGAFCFSCGGRSRAMSVPPAFTASSST
jgi:hypothetical protein